MISSLIVWCGVGVLGWVVLCCVESGVSNLSSVPSASLLPAPPAPAASLCVAAPSGSSSLSLTQPQVVRPTGSSAAAAREPELVWDSDDESEARKHRALLRGAAPPDASQDPALAAARARTSAGAGAGAGEEDLNLHLSLTQTPAFHLSQHHTAPVSLPLCLGFDRFFPPSSHPLL